MNIRRYFFFTFLLFAVSFFMNAQTAELIETLVGADVVNNGQAAWFVLIASNDSGVYDSYSQDQAFRHAVEKQWLPRNTRPSDNINLRNVSFLIMQAFDLKGGPMYALFKTPHYAYREMLQNDIIQGRAEPGMNVTGNAFLFMVSKVLFDMAESPWDLPPEPPEPEIIIAETPRPVDVIQETAVEEPKPEVIYDEGSLAYRLHLLESRAENGGSYVFELTANESISPHFLYFGGKTVSITIKGDGTRRTVSLRTAGSMFNVGSGVTLILDNNITIAGRNDNSESLIVVSRGNLVLNNGAVITGNRASYGGGVHFMGGNFTMNGGIIAGNNALNGSGVYVGYGRTFTMNGGVISGNTAFDGGGVYVSSNGTFNKTNGNISDNSASQYGGGVYVASGGTFNNSGGNISGNTAIFSGGGVSVNNGKFTMSNGEIAGNSAGNSGGGVYVFYYGVFVKTGGVIYGANDDINSNTVRDIHRNTLLRNMGHAVYTSVYSETAGDTIIRRREAAVAAGDNLSLAYSNNLPVWSGNWQ